MLALKVSLALIIFGGTGSALVLIQNQASVDKTPPSGALPSGAGRAGALLRGRAGPGRLRHGPACVRLP